MKAIVIYFSQTGNTKKVAEAIHAGMEAVTDQCDLVKLKDTRMTSLPGYDLIGLGCPVWEFQEPFNVKVFEENLPPMDGKHIFLFATHGAWRGGIFASIANVLHRKGLTVIGYQSWYGVIWIQAYPKPYVTDGHPDEIDLKEASDFGREMVDRSLRIARGESHLIPQSFGPEVPRIARAWVDMTLDREKCRYPKCRLCVDNCPLGAIDLSRDPIIFREPGKCLSCYLCELICPTGAIEADFTLEERRANESVRDPDIGVMRLIEKAEAKGHFRWLVEKKLGEEPLYKLTRRPRFPASRIP